MDRIKSILKVYCTQRVDFFGCFSQKYRHFSRVEGLLYDSEELVALLLFSELYAFVLRGGMSYDSQGVIVFMHVLA